MIKNVLFSLFFLFVANQSLAQRSVYDDAIKQAKILIKAQKYDDALLEVVTAIIATKQFKVDHSEAYAELKKVTLEIKKQHADLERAKAISDRQLKQFSVWMTQLTDLIQDDSNGGIIGFSPLKSNLLTILIPAQQYISNNANLNKSTEIANAHLQLGATYQNLGKSKASIEEYAQAYNMAKKNLSELSAQHIRFTDDATNVYLRAVEAHGRSLMNKGLLDDVGDLLNEAEEYIRTFNISNADNFDALARLENVFGDYMEEIDSVGKSVSYRQQALNYARKAINIDKLNLSYKNNLITCLNSLIVVLPKSLSDDLRLKYKKEAAALVSTLDNTAGNGGIFLVNLAACTKYQAFDAVEVKKYQEALDTLNKAINKIDYFLHLDPEQSELHLIKADLNTAIAQIYGYNLSNPVQQKIHLERSINEWIMTVKNKKVLPSNLLLLRKIYSDIASNLNNSFTKDEIVLINDNISKAIKSTGDEFGRYPQIARIVAILNLINGNALLQSGAEKSAVALRQYFQSAIQFFDYSKVTEKRNQYSEDFVRYCSAYVQLLTIDIDSDNYEQVQNDFYQIEKIFYPIYKIYNYDTELAWQIATANKLYGDFLVKRGKYMDAIGPLRLSSLEGFKSGSEALAKIYGMENLKNDKEKSRFLQIANAQQNGRTDIIVPTTGNGTNQSLLIHIVDHPIGFRFKGIEAQAKWALMTKGLSIDKNFVNIFNKYQLEAWNKNKSLQALSDKAIDDARNTIFILNKYEKNKLDIYSNQRLSYKLLLCEGLYKRYENDISTDFANREIIKNDAVKFDTFYADLLYNNGKYQEAQKVFERIAILDPKDKKAKIMNARFYFEGNKNKISGGTNKYDIEDLKIYLGFFLEDGELKKANNLKDRILLAMDDAKTREELSVVYKANAGDDNFSELFLRNEEKLGDYWNYFTSKDTSIMLSSKDKKTHFDNLILIGKAYLNTKPQEASEIKRSLVIYYNKCAWYCLLENKADDAGYYLNGSDVIDPGNKLTIVNRAHTLLLNDQIGSAKILYLKYKDWSFDTNGGYPTYKEIFLSNLKGLKDSGIRNQHIIEIINLLKE